MSTEDETEALANDLGLRCQQMVEENGQVGNRVASVGLYIRCTYHTCNLLEASEMRAACYSTPDTKTIYWECFG